MSAVVDMGADVSLLEVSRSNRVLIDAFAYFDYPNVPQSA